MGKFLYGILALVMLCVGTAEAAELTVAGAINKAGRQRMLVERSIKAYAQLGLQVEPDLSRQQLNDAHARFESQLAELKDFAPNPEIRAELANVESLWKPFKATLAAAVTKDGSLRLLAQGEALVAAADRVVQLLEAYSGIPQGRLVNDAGAERMLSQRLAKLYLMQAWGVAPQQARAEIKRTRAEFEAKLASLQAAPQNTYAIDRELEAVALQWAWFQSAIDQEGDYLSYQLVVAEASEAMLASIETLTSLYERLARR